MENGFPFRFPVIVREHEIDSYGHANYAVYLHWIEHARWELIHRLDINLSHGGVRAYVRHLDLDYLSEANCGDRLEVMVWPRRVGTTSFTIGSAVRIVRSLDRERDGEVALLATTVLVCVKPGVGKVPVPADWRALFLIPDPGPRPAWVDEPLRSM